MGTTKSQHATTRMTKEAEERQKGGKKKGVEGSLG